MKNFTNVKVLLTAFCLQKAVGSRQKAAAQSICFPLSAFCLLFFAFCLLPSAARLLVGPKSQIGNWKFVPALIQFAIPTVTGANAVAPSGPVLGASGYHGCANGASSCSVTVANQVAGALVVVWNSTCDQNDSVSYTISDSNSDTFNTRQNGSGLYRNQYVWDTTLSAGGSITYTASFSGSPCYPSLFVLSFTGVNASQFDQTGQSNTKSSVSNPYTLSTSGNLAQSQELIVGMAGIGGSGESLSAGSGFTAVNNATNRMDEYQIGGTAGSPAQVSFGTVNSGDPSAIDVVTYK